MRNQRGNIMAAKRTPKLKTQSRVNYSANYGTVQEQAQLRLIKGRPKLDHLLRSRCRVAFLVIALFAMLVVIRSGISASRGYMLVATQTQAEAVEQENERLRIEIAKLKSPSRIQQIAHDELGMAVPKKMYFSH